MLESRIWTNNEYLKVFKMSNHTHHIKLPNCLLCSGTLGLKQHHIIFKSQGGGRWTVTLCKDCERLAHTKGKKVEVKWQILTELKRRGLYKN